jgi:hypothetical protein
MGNSMSNFSDFIGGGGGGALIGEYVGFVDQGVTFTDANGHVWLRTGSGTLDTTTYPDALSVTLPVSYNSLYKSTAEFGSYSNSGLNVSGDWAIGTSTQNRYGQINLAKDTVNASNTQISSIASNAEIAAIGYITCTGPNVVSAQANTDNKFAVAIRDWNGPIRMQSFNLDGYNDASSIGSGALNQDAVGSYTYLYNSSGSQIRLDTSYSWGGIHWDASTHKLYGVIGDLTQGSLHVWDFTGTTFGTSDSVGPSTRTATTSVNYYYESTVAYVYALSGSATDLYVSYVPAPFGSNSIKIRKIPLSGNLSWASGSDVADYVKDDFSAQNPRGKMVMEDAQGNITLSGSVYANQAFYGMDGSDYTFISGAPTLQQWKMGEIIGSTTSSQVGPTGTSLFGVTYYQRIK